MLSSIPCSEEVEIASCDLPKKQENFKNWIEQSRDVLLKFKTTQILNCQVIQGEIKELEKKKKEFKEQANITSFSDSQKQELKDLDEQIKKLSIASQQKHHIKEVQKEKLKENEYAVKQKTEDITTKETDINKQLEKLEKGIKYFEQNLGLKVQRHPETHLTFIFTQIDEKSPQKEFLFDLSVEGSPGEYKVHHCSCVISDLEIFVEELNHTNDLKLFLCQMRNAFKKNCK